MENLISRIIELPQNYSFFLFGPRGVGKTTLLTEKLPKEKTYIIDLFDFNTETKIISSPAAFQEILHSLRASIQWVLIDEVQKVPRILNEIHRQIENKVPFHFAITGSNARKLKRGQANLLAGRAFTYNLFPLTSVELKEKFNIDHALAFGTLPRLLTLDNNYDKERFLTSYAQTYLKEEIQNEGIVRNLTGFRKFLPLVSSENGNELAWSNIAREAGIDSKTVQSYFQILEDTLVGFFLPAYRKSMRSRQKTHPKFYLFDTGVQRALEGTIDKELTRGSSEYGRAFEHFWILEIIRVSNYRQKQYRFSYFGTQTAEIDLVIEHGKDILFLIEIKSSESVHNKELRALHALAEDLPSAKALCISKEPVRRKIGNVLVCPWQEALFELGLA